MQWTLILLLRGGTLWADPGVDADTALSFQNIQFQRDGAELLDGVTAAQIPSR